MHRISPERRSSRSQRATRPPRACAQRLIPLAGLALCLGACQSPCSHDGFKRQLVGCASAIQAGDLDQARTRLQVAERCADSEAGRVKVRSLRGLIQGVEAMDRGDVAAARGHWSRIEHPALRAELNAAAARMDLSLADAPVVLTKE